MAAIPTPIAAFAEIQVYDNATVATPNGHAWLTDVRVEHSGTATVVGSKAQWSTTLVVIACVVALFTCGLGLILLFLSRQQRTESTMVDTVTITAPGWTYVAQGPGGAAFVSFLATWQTRIRATRHSVTATGDAAAGERPAAAVHELPRHRGIPPTAAP